MPGVCCAGHGPSLSHRTEKNLAKARKKVMRNRKVSTLDGAAAAYGGPQKLERRGYQAMPELFLLYGAARSEEKKR